MIKRVMHEIESMLLTNRIILDYPSVKAQNNRVNLHYFLAGNNEQNLGDYLSSIVVQYMLTKKGIHLDSCIGEKRDLYAIGSILLMGYQSATIWGSGLPFCPSDLRSWFHRPFFRKLDIRAVRGPLTRKLLIQLGHDCPERYGDPAILMPLIYTPKNREKSIKRLVIPHFSEESNTLVDIDYEKKLI